MKLTFTLIFLFGAVAALGQDLDDSSEEEGFRNQGNLINDQDSGEEGEVYYRPYYYFVYPSMDQDDGFHASSDDDGDDDSDELSRHRRSVYRQTTSTVYANPQHRPAYRPYPSNGHPVSSAAAKGAYVGASTASNNNYRRHPVSTNAAKGAFVGARAGSRGKRSAYRYGYRRRHYRPRRVTTAAYFGARAGANRW